MKKFSFFYILFSLSLLSAKASPLSDYEDEIILIISSIFIWLFISFCIYIAHSMISSKGVQYADSLGASLIGFIAIAFSFWLLGPILGAIVAIIAWFAVIMSLLDLNFGQSIAVTILAIIVYIILVILLASLVGIAVLEIF